MFSTRAKSHKINRLHVKGSIALLNDVNEMLSESNDTTIRVKDVPKLMIEFCKYLHGLSTFIIEEVFTKTILNYNLQSCKVTFLPNPKTKKYGIDTVAYKTAQLWRKLPVRYKNWLSLDLFKSEIKKRHCSDCPCNVFRIFVDGVGFII